MTEGHEMTSALTRSRRAQMRVAELQRRIRLCISALKAVEACLDTGESLSPDMLADRIREASRAAAKRD